MGVKICSYSKGSNGSELIALFKTGLSCFINKLSFKGNLKLLESVAKISKLSVHCTVTL